FGYVGLALHERSELFTRFILSQNKLLSRFTKKPSLPLSFHCKWSVATSFDFLECFLACGARFPFVT
ncbi:hypothetical protein, partial [Carnobacterium iners]|uniref:hypothetical protein n=1 Tax=Carnobacterium iners TaxID=1073423 RepID=UPI001F15F181